MGFQPVNAVVDGEPVIEICWYKAVSSTHVKRILKRK